MVNSTRTEFTPLPVRLSRNRNAVLHFSENRRQDGAPAVKTTQNDYERRAVNETHHSTLAPPMAGERPEGREVTCVQGSAQVQLQPRATEIQQETRECLQSSGSLNPLAAQSAIVPPVEHALSESAGLDLKPVSSVDQLEGYEPRYFLKEDGKDDGCDVS